MNAATVGLLLERTVDVGNCWQWAGPTNGVGYGRAHVGGRVQYVHRAGWEATRGPIPAGLVIDHLCRNTLCWNPGHLEPVTQRENTLRGRKGAATHCGHGHELTADNVYRTSAGHRQCRKCKARRERERRARLSGAIRCPF